MNLTTRQTPLYSVKIGISAVDETGAEQNLNEEIKGFDFETLKKEAQDEWNTKLNKISVTSQRIQITKQIFIRPFITQ